MKEKYKIQIFIGVLISVALLFIAMMLDHYMSIPFANIGVFIISFQILYLTIIVVKYTSDKDKK